MLCYVMLLGADSSAGARAAAKLLLRSDSGGRCGSKDDKNRRDRQRQTDRWTDGHPTVRQTLHRILCGFASITKDKEANRSSTGLLSRLAPSRPRTRNQDYDQLGRVMKTHNHLKHDSLQTVNDYTVTNNRGPTENKLMYTAFQKNAHLFYFWNNSVKN